MKRFFLFFLSLLGTLQLSIINFQLSIGEAKACTNLIVGKKASADGSVIVTYSSDDYGAYGYLFYQKGGKHQPGEMRKLYHYESNNYLGEIPEADSTYAVIGLTNEHQLTILETTWGGREELADSTGLFDYGSLTVANGPLKDMYTISFVGYGVDKDNKQWEADWFYGGQFAKK